MRSGTAVAANYRAAQRGRSDKEFCAKIGIVVEEADETQLWLELLPEAFPDIERETHRELLKEAGELTAIFTASHQTVKAKLEKKKEERKKERAARARPNP